jgi:hypothetical protein
MQRRPYQKPVLLKALSRLQAVTAVGKATLPSGNSATNDA